MGDVPSRATRGLTPKTPKIAELAERIAAHLRRFEADPAINPPRPDHECTRAYWGAGTTHNKTRVSVTYVSYHGGTCLTKDNAAAYLAWLDAGGVGRHWEWEVEMADKSKKEITLPPPRQPEEGRALRPSTRGGGEERR